MRINRVLVSDSCGLWGKLAGKVDGKETQTDDQRVPSCLDLAAPVSVLSYEQVTRLQVKTGAPCSGIKISQEFLSASGLAWIRIRMCVSLMA